MTTAIRIVDITQTVITRPRDPDDKWDGDDTYTSHHIQGFLPVKGEKEFRDLDIPFKVSKDKTYYLLYVIYSTGDSFHHEEGCIEFIDLYQTKDKAEIAAKAIEKHYEKNKEYNIGKDRYSLPLTRDDLSKIVVCPPWIGYFDRLTSVNVESVTLMNERRRNGG